MTDPKLKSLVERIERLMDERDGLGDDIRDVFTEVKSAGYVPKVLRKVIVRRRMDPNKRAEEDSWQEMYEAALDGPTRKALSMAASGATARQIEQETGIDQATVARSVSLKKRRETKPPNDPETGGHDVASQDFGPAPTASLPLSSPEREARPDANHFETGGGEAGPQGPIPTVRSPIRVESDVKPSISTPGTKGEDDDADGRSEPADGQPASGDEARAECEPGRDSEGSAEAVRLRGGNAGSGGEGPAKTEAAQVVGAGTQIDTRTFDEIVGEHPAFLDRRQTVRV